MADRLPKGAGVHIPIVRFLSPVVWFIWSPKGSKYLTIGYLGFPYQESQ